MRLDTPAIENIDWGFCEGEIELALDYPLLAEMIDDMYVELATLITFSQVCHVCGQDWMWERDETARPHLCPRCQDAIDSE